MGYKIINSLIPAIANLRTDPVSFFTMFSYDILQELGLPSMINCGDLDASDRFFKTILSKWVGQHPTIIDSALIEGGQLPEDKS